MALFAGFTIPFLSHAAELKAGDQAPNFSVQTDENSTFDLAARKGKWTVLYFYPKAETPGCTKQACAFRDSIKVIREQGAEVYGVSTDKVDSLQAFKKHHSLNFTLLADPKGEVVKSYGTKMPIVGFSKRWTFIVNPDLKIAHIFKDVDPVMDPKRVSEKLKELKGN